ncbi:glycosyltransferase family 2 protein [Belnapia sp. T6]|uniref:Glycosyltransferase family 2 protein n=1 Tax=Belnapia mucosa TaxID=2804532 RepID=A0ABS1V878_9PROT|nr:glycosyltransferase family 2 protein [Belnapia mucosa]MBL6457865.1 glycosyltransferase family 2 protein [Belnapia mucosa]
MTMRVLILGGGHATVAEGPPVLLAENNGELLLERFVRLCAGLDARLIFAIREADLRRYHIDNVVALAAPGAAVVPISGETGGAACTALLAIAHIAPEEELLVLASNELLEIDFRAAVDEMRGRGLDGGTVVFPSLHPRYAYVALDEAGYMIEASEKNPISRLATASFYWFRRGADFIAAVQDMIRKDAHVNGAFYINLAFNQMILRQRRLGVVQIEARHYRPLKSPRQIAAYEAEDAMAGALP